MVISNRVKLILSFVITLTSLLMVSGNTFADNNTANKVYKWKDSADKWHYSKLPPNQASKTPLPEDLEVAKDAKTIIFEKQTSQPITENEQLAADQKEKQQKQSCQFTQSNMMETASFYRKDIDRKLQEKSITIDEYRKETLSVNKLEEIASDINFLDYCMADFIPKPQFKSVSRCILKKTSIQARVICLKELPQTE